MGCLAEAFSIFEVGCGKRSAISLTSGPHYSLNQVLPIGEKLGNVRHELRPVRWHCCEIWRHELVFKHVICCEDRKSEIIIY